MTKITATYDTVFTGLVLLPGLLIGAVAFILQSV